MSTLTQSAAEMLYLSTMAKMKKGVVDVVFCEDPLLAMFERKADSFQCGPEIQTTYMTDGNHNFQWFDGYETLNTDPSKGLAMNAWDWQQWQIPISLCRKEELINCGPEQVVNLLQMKIKQAVLSAREALTCSILEGCGNIDPDPAKRQFWGLDKLIGDELSDVTVLGSNRYTIDAKICDWFRSLVIRPGDDKVLNNVAIPLTCAAPTAGNPNATTQEEGQVVTLDHLDTIIDCIEECKTRPEMALVSKKMLRSIIRMLQATGCPTMGNSETLRLGVENVVYRGIEFMAHKKMKGTICTGANGTKYEKSDIYFINFDDIKLFKHSGDWFTQSPFITPANVAARYAHIFGMGNMCVSDRRGLGRINCAITVC